MDLGLKDKVAIVTGGGSGIGRATCEVFAEEGVRVVIPDMNLDGANETAERVRALGRRALSLKVDVTKLEEVRQMVKRALDEFGKIDILVNNAGFTPYKHFIKTSKEDWDFIINLQYYHVLNCCHAVLPHMIERKYGKIVSVLSDAWKGRDVGLSVYGGAKAAIERFSETLSREVARYCINVNCVAPGATHTGGTDMWVKAMGLAKVEDYFKRVQPLFPLSKGFEECRGEIRIGKPRDLANMIVFLCSDRTEWVTGQAISVSGGF
jgi:2-hydroxycyclohexanecarboxyl-CoA dehydrogenase